LANVTASSSSNSASIAPASGRTCERFRSAATPTTSGCSSRPSGRAQLFRLAAGDYEGAINHVAIAFEHATFEHVGIGVALDYFEVDLDSNDTSFLGAFELKFTGPRLFAHMSF
jgi:hypothetical protein